MQLDLKDFFSNEAVKSLEFQYTMDLSDTEVGNVYPFTTPVEVTGEVRGNLGCAELSAKVRFGFTMPCDRCAEDIHSIMTYAFSHKLLLSDQEECEDDGFIRIKSHFFDLDELLREDILLELPLQYLCKQDCRGLCPICGQNLNQGSCSCREDRVDPRLEVLRKLIT